MPGSLQTSSWPSHQETTQPRNTASPKPARKMYRPTWSLPRSISGSASRTQTIPTQKRPGTSLIGLTQGIYTRQETFIRAWMQYPWRLNFFSSGYLQYWNPRYQGRPRFEEDVQSKPPGGHLDILWGRHDWWSWSHGWTKGRWIWSQWRTKDRRIWSYWWPISPRLYCLASIDLCRHKVWRGKYSNTGWIRPKCTRFQSHKIRRLENFM